jgi:xylose isomerase
MRTYLILKEKVNQFNEDAEIQRVIAEIKAEDEAYAGPRAGDGYSADHAAKLGEQAFDVDALAGRGRRYEELDQLLIDLLLGAR